ncbi:MAG: amino acid ABC transporter permease [Deltaproteobacteria bacterium]|jgi:polar amino acid transport system permease protein|nr:amino acid ABC transporter permease [Deltaproteobacteria bacterium]
MGTWEFYLNILIPALNKGLLVSIQIIVPSAILGVIIGILVGAGRALGSKWLTVILDSYVAVFRGTPLVVQLMLWFYGLPSIRLILEAHFGPEIRPISNLFLLSPYVASVAAFAMCSGAYQSEYIRGAILSIKKGQFKAALSLGFTKSQTFWHITCPMAIRRALPGCGNEIIYLIKYSSLAMIVTMSELTGEAKGIASLYFRHLECYLLTAVYYLLLVTIASFILKKIENYLAIPGQLRSQ